MKSILGYIRRYFATVKKNNLFETTFFTAILVTINYSFHLDGFIRYNHSFGFKLFAWFVVFWFAFIVPYLLAGYSTTIRKSVKFACYILLAPLLFAIKLSLDIDLDITTRLHWNHYWNHIIYWPLLLLIMGGLLFLTWKLFDSDQPFYGLSGTSINWRPYFLMLLIMVPLIALASTQHDFLEVYPKLQTIAATEELKWWHQLIFELSYGSDFLGIELFFRGFLILGFIKWAGKDAILPMACFYCTIHFGKPLGECISSYLGGIILGIVVYNTRSILGGLLVHLGIAWMMELGGYIGNHFFK